MIIKLLLDCYDLNYWSIGFNTINNKHQNMVI